VQIQEIDKSDDDLMARMYAVVTASQSVERPFFTPQPQDAAISDLRHVDPGERCDLLGVFDADELVGVVTLWMGLTDNVDTAWMQLDVHPDHRRRGAGAAAISVALAHCASLGRTRAVGSARYPESRAEDHPNRRFAERHGFRLGSVDINRRLALPVPSARATALLEQARAAYEGDYRIDTFTEIPEELLAPLCACINRVEVEAPTGEIEWEEESLTPERLRGYAALDRQSGRLRFTSIARQVATGAVAGYTDLFVTGAMTRAMQSGTFVVGEHRGRRLGLGLKLANLAALQTARPQVREIFTGNNSANLPMVAVNEALGFQPVEIIGEFYRSVP
jgi:GNAT superfamily N-acetyltransferase